MRSDWLHWIIKALLRTYDEFPAHVDDIPPNVTSPPDRESGAFADWLGANDSLLRIAIWLFVGASIAIGTFMWATGRLDVQNVGYVGVLAVNLIGSASIVVPVPGLFVVCAGAAEEIGLNPALLGLAGGFGSTIGELSGYLAGYGGSPLIQKSRYYDRIRRWVHRYGGLTLFTLSVIPNPVFDIAGIAAGSLGYSLRRFLLFVLAGKLIKFVAVAYACRFSIDWITNLF